MKKFLRCDRGSAAVEFVLIAPPLIALLLGMIEFGRYHWTQNGLRYAVEEAGRYAIAHGTATSQTLTNKVLATAPRAGGTPSVSVQTSTADGMNYITIQATTQFQFLIPFVPLGAVTIASSTKVPVGTS